jgi:hypothetical protein
VFFGGKDVVHFLVKHVATAFAEANEVADQIVFFLNEQSQAFSPPYGIARDCRSCLHTTTWPRK